MRMRMLALIIASAVAATALPPTSLSAQAMKSLEFKNQEMRDILFVLAELNNVSIILD